ncbi:MAG: TIGR04283 family arsenosugar biosynthesis glycosyltransferase [Alphaproteobacteria bacterium]
MSGTPAARAPSPGPLLVIVVPTLNAESRIVDTLAALRAGSDTGLVRDILVVDGGSRDATVACAQHAGVRVATAPRGRGGQLAAGAAAVSGDWLLFVHADTTPGTGWADAVARFVADPANKNRAGYFRFALDDDSPSARRLERRVAWRCRTFGLPYGDQGLLVSRVRYDAVGGYRPLPLMEDVDLVRRLGRDAMVELPVAAVTAADRFRRDGYTWRSLRNLACLALYFAGVPPRTIARLYGR